MDFKIASLLLVLLCPMFASGQDHADFGNVLQTYYITHDKDLLDKTLAFVNSPQTEYKRNRPLLTGFFGALFAIDPATRKRFRASLKKMENPEFKSLFEDLATTPFDSINAKTPLSPEYNDMNWAAFFATGNTKYLDHIIANIRHAEDRVDLMLYLTGASAKWSLCSNARNDKAVKAHLQSLEKNIAGVGEILTKDPGGYKDEMVKVIQEQRAKGLWMGQ